MLFRTYSTFLRFKAQWLRYTALKQIALILKKIYRHIQNSVKQLVKYTVKYVASHLLLPEFSKTFRIETVHVQYGTRNLLHPFVYRLAQLSLNISLITREFFMLTEFLSTMYFS